MDGDFFYAGQVRLNRATEIKGMKVPELGIANSYFFSVTVNTYLLLLLLL